MRQFLMKFIIPVLTEGMIEACKVGPLDPVDYLAEYIFKRSSEFREVKNWLRDDVADRTYFYSFYY